MHDLVEAEYYAVGGNRHCGAADWSTTSGLLAFGADQNVGIWSPLDESGRGISALLSGHKEKVTAAKFLSLATSSTQELLTTGCAAGEVAVWRQDDSNRRWHCLDKQKGHDGTVNAISFLNQSNVFVTGGADAKVKVWKIEAEKIQALAVVPLKPRFIPLTLAAGLFTSDALHNSAFVAVGGTRNDVRVYSVDNLTSNPDVKLCATLGGHEAWIQSLALTPISDGGFLLASASQDKYVRLWRFHSNAFSQLNGTSTAMSTLAAKVQSVSVGDHKYSITFEALLLGHEDWIYSATWNPDNPTNPQLLTASADGSLSIWEADPTSGIWISISRLGEISGQKGATTATGSAGGFWTGLWGPDGKTVTCLGRTGSWRLWQYNGNTQFWAQRYGISGHTSLVDGICWSPDGGYFLSTSSDQTTRLHAQWKRGEKRSWHEFSRPQIHGYDLNCVTSTSPHQFCSGADEKLLRVFNEPNEIANMLHRLCGVALPEKAESLPHTAAIPVLGLSNKAMDKVEEAGTNGAQGDDLDQARIGTSDIFLHAIEEPPTEDLLARHTLWPEHEKLYGHGSEISEAATSPDGSVLATACKASSLDQAVIRLYETTTWNEIRPPLSAHSLTVMRLAFSAEGEYLLSVGRDRQWACFKRLEQEGESRGWIRVASNPKAHSRMILDATWLPGLQQPTFATAGRDKTVKIWSKTADSSHVEFRVKASIARTNPVSAVSATYDGFYPVLAVGEDDGSISLHTIDIENDLKVSKSVDVLKDFCPSKTVNRLAWRPDGVETNRSDRQLAVASADGSVRILNVKLEGLSRD